MKTTKPKTAPESRKAPNLIDMTGRVFGRLKVQGKAASRTHGRGTVAYWICLCKCGEITEVRGDKLREGEIRSCGCAADRKTPAKAAAPAKPEPVFAPAPAPVPEPEPEPMPQAPAAVEARPVRPPRTLTPEDRARMVNAFLVSGFTRAEAEEMACMGTALTKPKES